MDSDSIRSDMEETVYTTQDDHHDMSEKVQTLAATVYQEFERMMKTYDEDVVKELMPLVVGILESLDVAFSDKQEREVELELLRDDNEQLLTQYEREKQLRRSAEQKYLEVEDNIEAEHNEMTSKVESLESIVRMLELKSRNASDHVSRLEDKETDMKKEYSKLHERYTELFKAHMDYMERAKLLMGAEYISDLSPSPRLSKGSLLNLPLQKPYNIVMGGAGESPAVGSISPAGFDTTTPTLTDGSNVNLKSEMESQQRDSTEVSNVAKMNEEDKTTEPIAASTPEDINRNESVSTNRNSRNNESLFDELTPENIGDVDLGADVTGKEVSPGDYASSDEEPDGHDQDEVANDNFYGMGREVENLIEENNELLATKNALNIVKDDLIAKVDDLLSEQEILREEVHSLQMVKTRLQQRITQLEDDLKKTKEELDKRTQPPTGEDEEDVPMAQRKRFTRVEMARVLMERNQYKERLMELQEAVRWTEMIRASREHPELVPKKKSSMWSLFSNLFSSSNKPNKKALPSASIKYNAPTSDIRPLGDPNKKSRSAYNLGEKAKAYEFLQDDLNVEKAKKERERSRKEQYKQVRAHVKKEDGRLQAYGWSLPARLQPIVPLDRASRTHIPVPVPVYCRPLMEKDVGLTIWCAAGVNLSGGKTHDGGSVVGASVFYKDDESICTSPPIDNIDELNAELKVLLLVFYRIISK